jgi:hypothetical protein
MSATNRTVGCAPAARKGATVWLATAALIVLAVLAANPAAAGPEGCQPVPPAGVAARRIVQSYASVLDLCTRGAVRRIAIRSMRLDGKETMLLVDPDRLTTSLEPAACWACSPVTDEQVAESRFESAVRRARDKEGRPLGDARMNAGFTDVSGSGASITLDLCPSRKPLDRWILSAVAARQDGAPVALSVTGAWMRSHPADMAWLLEQNRAGALAITWVDHTDLHRYVPGLRPDRNLMLLPGTDPVAEILGAERQLIAAGGTPSVFFRFPGLVSTPALSEVVASQHLVVLGASAWLALGQKPRPGSVILAHANGNEPQGLAALSKQLSGNPDILPLRAVLDVR